MTHAAQDRPQFPEVGARCGGLTKEALAEAARPWTGQITVTPCPNTAVTLTTVTVVVRFFGVGGTGAGTIYDTTLATLVAQ